MSMDWLTGPISKAVAAIVKTEADAMRADVKTELDALRADLPNIVEAAARGGAQAVIDAVMHPFGHAQHLNPPNESPQR